MKARHVLRRVGRWSVTLWYSSNSFHVRTVFVVLAVNHVCAYPKRSLQSRCEQGARKPKAAARRRLRCATPCPGRRDVTLAVPQRRQQFAVLLYATPVANTENVWCGRPVKCAPSAHIRCLWRPFGGPGVTTDVRNAKT